ncbi:hypothetical protein [Actinocorallia aurantiaca]|uniref:hypothetical protein n=1 Tax=Actinocorallia aurantiaca TaxID=46204 RepID=UPI0031CF2B43
MTALVASNFRGKTSVLELITWCLRGTPRDLKVGVQKWLTEVDLDAWVAGQPLGVRLTLDQGKLASAVVLTAAGIELLEGAHDASSNGEVTAVLRASGEESYAEQVQALMMDRLDLAPLVNVLQETSTQTHGWPAYYSSIYPKAGGDKVLLGDVSVDGLPGRLLQVFLDLPATSVLTRVKAVHSLRAAEVRNREAGAREESAARAADRRRFQEELESAAEALSQLTAVEGPSLPDLAARARALSAQVADEQEAWDDTMQAHRRALRARQRDQRAFNDVSESVTARLLFHGLDPTVCPRCDQDIAEDRRVQELHQHECAVCTRPVTGEDLDSEEIIEEARGRLKASTAAQEAAASELQKAEDRLTEATERLKDADQALRDAQSAVNVTERLRFQEAVLRAEGALSALPEIPELTSDPAEVRLLTILKASTVILDEDSKKAAEELFGELNEEIAALGRGFGIDSLERVAIDRAARLKVFSDGGAQSWFSGQAAGERLRLRIAVVVALLRVGARHGISTHPGLLLIDSPKAEEVQDLDAHALIKELEGLARENSLQILITTTDAGLAHDLLADENIIEARDGEPLW